MKARIFDIVNGKYNLYFNSETKDVDFFINFASG